MLLLRLPIAIGIVLLEYIAAPKFKKQTENNSYVHEKKIDKTKSVSYKLIQLFRRNPKVQAPQKYSGTAPELFNRIVAGAECDAREAS